MKWHNIFAAIGNWLANLLFVIAVVTVIIGFILLYTKVEEPTTSPVEESKIDSIIIENSKIIIEVEHLDSIKDAEVIEVKTLDNDSTLRLFYKLIGKQ